MIATLIALVLVSGPPQEPKPPTANRTIASPGLSPAARAEAARKKQARNRLRALNSRRLAGMDGATGYGSLGSMNDGGFGGGWASSFEQQLASTFRQAQSAMAAGQDALAATASLS